jgi:uracil-DNA glycosylase family 4
MGFFFTETINRQKKAAKKTQLAVDILEQEECKACPLRDAPVRSGDMKPSGSKNPVVYFLGEAPGKEEDFRGKPFVGPAGSILRKEIPTEWEDKVRFNNTVRTRPPNNRTPVWQEIAACRPSVVRDIEETKPKAIFGMGGVPLRWALGRDDIGQMRGRRFPVKIGNHYCWYYPMYHPSFILRKGKTWKFKKHITEVDLDKNSKIWKIHPSKTNEGLVFSLDMAKAFNEVEDLPPAFDIYENPNTYYDGIECFTGQHSDELTKIKAKLKKFKELPLVGVDIETTCLRPYSNGAKLLSVAIGDYDEVISIALEHREAKWSPLELEKLYLCLDDFLVNSKCTKIAHNLAFELEWFSYFINRKILSNQYWADTQVQAYCIDERTRALDLDTLIHQYFGFKLKDLSNVDRKNLSIEKLDKVLLYNGLDSKYTSFLYEEQKYVIIKSKLKKIEKQQLKRIPPIVRTQLKGIAIDQPAVRRCQKKLGTTVEKLEEDMNNLDVVKEFVYREGGLNPNSTHDTTKIFRDYLKCTEGQRGKRYSTDKEVLEQIDHPLAELLAEYRSVTTIKSTFIDKSRGDHPDTYIYPDGLIHTSLNTMFTKTGRLSSDRPNTQNFPKHGGHKWLRQILIPPKDHAIVAFDYAQIEARVIAMFSQDDFLIKALWDRYDIHMEWAEKFAKAYPPLLSDGKTMKDLRQDIKSNFVFASFYGAIAKTTAVRLGVPEIIVTGLLKEFWETFKGAKVWQRQLKRNYRDKGYVECLTGRRRHAPLSINKIINTPVQGTASDIVVDAMTRLSEFSVEQGRPQFQAIMNIHDDLTFYLPLDTLKEDVGLIAKQMVNVPFEWAHIVPIGVEVEKSEEGWDKMEAFCEFESTDYI